MKPASITPLIIAFLLGLLSRRRSQAAIRPLIPPEDEQTGGAAPAAVNEDGGPNPAASGFAVKCYEWLKEHFWFVSLATTALAAFLVIVKALVLADGDLNTATVLFSDGISGVALSAFIASLPFMALGAVTTAGFTFDQARQEGAPIGPPSTVLLTAIALSLAVVPWWMTLIAAAVSIILMRLFRKFSSRNVTASIASQGWQGYWFLALLGLLVGWFAGQWITMGRMWLPAESILIQTASTNPAAPASTTDQLIGYVISEDGSYLTVLSEEDRLITYVKASEVADRTRCQLEPQHWSEFPLPWGGAANKYGRC